MAVGLALLYVVLALGGLGLFLRGITMVAAADRLDGRIARATSASVLTERRGPALPNFIAARGRDREEIVNKLLQAGFQGEDAIERFLWIRLAVTGVALVFMALLSRWVWGSVFAKPLLLFLFPALIYLGAKRALVIAANGRARAVTAEFPFLLDMLLMMLESGISLDQCFRTIARDEAVTVPQLHRTLQGLVEDLDRGMGYEAALGRWATRVAVPGATDLAALFLQGLFQGVELGGALRQFIREFTERRIAAAREAMGKIAVKLVVVMIVFFMPALFIVIGGPPVTSLFDMIRTMRS